MKRNYSDLSAEDRAVIMIERSKGSSMAIARSLERIDESSDVIIRCYTPELRRKGFASRPLLTNAAVAVCAPGHPASETLRTPSDLLRAPLLDYPGLPQVWQYWFHQAGVPVGETWRGHFYDELALMLKAATSGLGVSLAPRRLVRDEVFQ